jgi:hypothetical protein
MTPLELAQRVLNDHGQPREGYDIFNKWAHHRTDALDREKTSPVKGCWTHGVAYKENCTGCYEVLVREANERRASR